MLTSPWASARTSGVWPGFGGQSAVQPALEGMTRTGSGQAHAAKSGAAC